jgi:competence protein ComEA
LDDADQFAEIPALLSPPIQRAARWGALSAIALIAAFAWWSRPDPGAARPGAASAGLQIDLNRATRQELMLMPGVGGVTADRIVADRQRHGPFRTLGDLERVHGVGPRTVEALAPYCCVTPPDASGANTKRLAEN